MGYIVTRPICNSKGLMSQTFKEYLVVKSLHDLAHYLSIDTLGRETMSYYNGMVRK